MAAKLWSVLTVRRLSYQDFTDVPLARIVIRAALSSGIYLSSTGDKAGALFPYPSAREVRLGSPARVAQCLGPKLSKMERPAGNPPA